MRCPFTPSGGMGDGLFFSSDRSMASMPSFLYTIDRGSFHTTPMASVPKRLPTQNGWATNGPLPGILQVRFLIQNVWCGFQPSSPSSTPNGCHPFTVLRSTPLDPTFPATVGVGVGVGHSFPRGRKRNRPVDVRVCPSHTSDGSFPRKGRFVGSNPIPARGVERRNRGPERAWKGRAAAISHTSEKNNAKGNAAERK